MSPVGAELWVAEHGAGPHWWESLDKKKKRKGESIVLSRGGRYVIHRLDCHGRGWKGLRQKKGGARWTNASGKTQEGRRSSRSCILLTTLVVPVTMDLTPSVARSSSLRWPRAFPSDSRYPPLVLPPRPSSAPVRECPHIR